MGASAGAVRVGARVVVAWGSLAVATACLTVLFLGMRSVMEVGGFCASGGPYVIEDLCPKGVAWMMPVSIMLGLLALGIHVVASIGLPGPRFALLAWPALFLSLGWNFWEYGLDPGADNGGGTAVGWIVCGVVFVLMGGLPLVWLLASPTGRRSLLWADGTSTTDRPTVRATAASVSPLAVRQFRAESAMHPPPGPERPWTTTTMLIPTTSRRDWSDSPRCIGAATSVPRSSKPPSPSC